jgi:hypothetical protein
VYRPEVHVRRTRFMLLRSATQKIISPFQGSLLGVTGFTLTLILFYLKSEANL